MARGSASAKVTGGGGFSYENCVAAYYILEMIARHQPLGPEHGQVHAVDFQASESGWLLDDLVVALGDATRKHHLAVSVRSYTQVTRNGFPDDFVRLIWQQWLQKTSDVFQQDHDLLGLVVDNLAYSVERAWMGMLGDSLKSSPDRIVLALASPGSSNEIQRKLFASLACPADLRQEAHTDELATARLLKHIRLLHMDFQAEPSKSVETCLALCQEVLRTGDPKEATVLWSDTVGMADDHRHRRGTITLAKAVRILSAKHELRMFPDYARDWERLSRASSEAMSGISCTIGNQTLPRTDLMTDIQDELGKKRAIVLIGDSGAGKSAVSRMLAQESLHKGQDVVWLNSDLLGHSSLSGLERELQLAYSLSEVLSASPAGGGLIVIDAIDRLSDDGVACAARLLTATGAFADDCQWKFLATAQPEGWAHILPELTHNGIDREFFAQHVVELPEVQAITSLTRQFPQIAPLLLRQEFARLFRNLKVLDWVSNALKTAEGGALQRCVSPTDVIAWVWDQWIGRDASRHVRDGLLKSVAEREAESLTAGVALTTLDAGQQVAIDGLEQRGLLRCRSGRLFLQHDLLGDWARLQFLISQGVEAPMALKAKGTLLRWHTAIRLYGEWLLEKADGEPAPWREAMGALSDEVSDEHIVRDLLLESVVLAMNSAALLELLWSNLVASGGGLLTRLLKRFLHVGTVPDPRIMEFARNDNEAHQLASVIRVPYWPYWGPVLSCLSRHKDSIPVSSQHTVATVCCKWLESTPLTFTDGRPYLWRREAADTAFALARETQALKAEGRFFRDGDDEKPYEAALHAAPDLPEAVSALSLELCRRRPESEVIVSRREAAEARRKKEWEEWVRNNPEEVRKQAKLTRSLPPFGFHEDWPLRNPWPDGPTSRVDDGFQRVCFKAHAAFSRLIDACPSVAAEVLLAVSIEEPKPDAPLRRMDLRWTHLGTKDLPEVIPPMYSKGPFLQFLRRQPDAALGVIITLVDFATERSLEIERAWRHLEHPVTDGTSGSTDGVISGGALDWPGGELEYRWHRNIGLQASVVATSLMAVEKWLYELIDLEIDVKPWIDRIVRESRSTAFLGMLASVGKRTHSLLAGPLLPTLGLWPIYEWDSSLILADNVWQMEAVLWRRSGERVWDVVREWHEMPHRKSSLRDLAAYLMLTNERVSAFFAETRVRWAEFLKDNPDNEGLELLIARFDPKNYRAVKGEDGKSYISLEWPERIRERMTHALQKSERAMRVLGFPFRCRQILDDDKDLDAAGIEAFWEELVRISNSEDEELPNTADAVCGGIAVLVVRHFEWLTNEPQRWTWCQEKLSDIMTEPPGDASLMISRSIMTTRWDCFVADIAIALLSRTPGDKHVRQMVAESITSYYYVVTGLAMLRAFGLREALGEEFTRMQNLVLLWAALRCVKNRAEQLQVDVKAWPTWCDRFVARYVVYAIPEHPFEWDHVEDIGLRLHARVERRYQSKWPPLYPEQENDEEDKKAVTNRGRRRRNKSKHFPGFDVEVLQNAFAWLLNGLDGLGAAKERRANIILVERLLQITLRMVGIDGLEEEEEVSGTPYSYDYWVFGLVSRFVAQMRPEESPEELWKPILDLGPRAHYWVEGFLDQWTTKGLDAAGNPIVFGEQWRKMMEYALSHPSWAIDGRQRHNVSDMLTKLMGLGLASELLGGEEYTDLITSLGPFYERWAAEWLGHWQALTSFAGFLCLPACRNIICSAVKWIDAAIVQYDDYDWRGFKAGDLESVIGEVLRVCWAGQKATVITNTELRTCFLRTLSLLANRQCPHALELRDEVLRTIKA